MGYVGKKWLTRLAQVKIVAIGNVSSCESIPQCWQLNHEKFGRFSLHFFLNKAEIYLIFIPVVQVKLSDQTFFHKLIFENRKRLSNNNLFLLQLRKRKEMILYLNNFDLIIVICL